MMTIMLVISVVKLLTITVETVNERHISTTDLKHRI